MCYVFTYILHRRRNTHRETFEKKPDSFLIFHEIQLIFHEPNCRLFAFCTESLRFVATWQQLNKNKIRWDSIHFQRFYCLSSQNRQTKMILHISQTKTSKWGYDFTNENEWKLETNYDECSRKSTRKTKVNHSQFFVNKEQPNHIKWFIINNKRKIRKRDFT